ncbi:MAG: outer membrane beta-barrel protein, partial [Bdellovibrionia bacterium]
MNKLLVFAALIFLSFSARAEITPHLDLYYLYNFNEPFPPNPMSGATVVNATQPAGNNALRFYDQFHNQFSLALVEFSLTKSFETSYFLADLDFGQSADLNARQTTGALRIVDESTKHVGQALVSWSPRQVNGLRLEFGKFASHMG